MALCIHKQKARALRTFVLQPKTIMLRQRRGLRPPSIIRLSVFGLADRRSVLHHQPAGWHTAFSTRANRRNLGRVVAHVADKPIER